MRLTEDPAGLPYKLASRVVKGPKYCCPMRTEVLSSNENEVLLSNEDGGIVVQ
jgi:hypothetical protein